MRNYVILGAMTTSAGKLSYIAAPATPTNLTAASGDTTATLTWDDPSNAKITKYQYRVWKGTEQVAGWTDIPSSGATTTTYTVPDLTNGTTYTIFLRAVISDLIYSTIPAMTVVTPNSN